MNRFSSVRDNTATQTVGGPGMPMRVPFLCEGTGPKHSGQWKGGIPLRCLKCAKCKAQGLAMPSAKSHGST